MATLALGATALIVPGTGTPNANIVPNYMQNARDYYLQGTACTTNGGCDNPGDDLIGIDYPASFWPLPFPGWCRSGPDGCDTWNVSVGEGVEALDGKLDAALATRTSTSSSSATPRAARSVSNEMRKLADPLPGT